MPCSFAKNRRRSAFISPSKVNSASTTRRRRLPRQIVRHGHVEVKGRKVNIPSYQVKVGDEIKIRPNSQKLSVLETSREFASHQPAPTWLSVDHANLSGKVLSLPKREDVQLPVNEQLIVELYSK